LAREVDGQFIENSYRLQITNSSHQGHRFIIKPQGLHGLSIIGDSDVFVEGGQNSTAIISLQLPLANVEQLQKGSHKIRIDVTAKDDPALSVSEKAAFFIPR
jgi:polyferredoxin